MKRTIKQLNEQAGIHLAFNWMQDCEKMLQRRLSLEESFGHPLRLQRLSTYTAQDIRETLGDVFWDIHGKDNANWWISPRNAKLIVEIAVRHALLTLNYAPDRYPLTRAYWIAQQKQAAQVA